MVNDFKTSFLYRILTAIVALPVYLFAIGTDYFYSFPVLIASLVITLMSLYEFYKLSNKGDQGRPFVLFGMTAGALVNFVMYYFAFGYFGKTGCVSAFDARLFFMAVCLFLGVVLIAQLFFRPIKGGIYSLSATVFGVIYIVFFFSHIILMKALQDGFLYILILNIVVILNDTAAYFGGSLFGKHKMKFPVSPNKSWEGYFSGLVISIIAMVVTNEVFAAFLNKALFSFTESLVLGVLLSIFGNLGDLIESGIKRDASIKDSGSLLPGHGGMWDVFDALIFTMPFFYYYLVLKGVS